MDEIGSKLKSARKSKNITHAELAQRLGLSFGIISLYENGIRTPRKHTLHAICRELNLNPETLEPLTKKKYKCPRCGMEINSNADLHGTDY